jgi:succinoglycan biosynthesis transport protein ExoP
MESVQQESFPVSGSRLITQATRPLRKSAPRSSLILALAALGGLLLGAAVGMLRDISDRVFRTTRQVEDLLQADCISMVPLVKDAKLGESEPNADANKRAVAPAVARDGSLLWAVVDSPFTRFAESIRAVKVALDLNKAVKANKVIGVTSSLPNEGKSTIATALTELISSSGGRAVLVDCDLRNPALSRKLAPDAQSGLLEVIAGHASIRDVLRFERATGLAFLPAVVRSRLANSSEILGSDAIQEVFDKLREMYDYVIVDLSPLAPVVDVRAMTHLVDSFVFVVEWGRTKIDVAEHALAGARGVYENLLGVVLNKADMDAIGRYESFRGNYYYNRYYARYGYTD